MDKGREGMERDVVIKKKESEGKRGRDTMERRREGKRLFRGC